jgi:hypothetical protein
VIETDLAGNLVKGWKTLGRRSFQRILMYDNGNFRILQGERLNFSKAKTGPFETRMELCREDLKNETHKSGLAFVQKSHMVKHDLKGGGIALGMNTTIPVRHAVDPQNKMLYVVDSETYKINKVSMGKEKILAVFNREYSRVDYEKPEDAEAGDPPPPDYFNDVTRLYFHNNQLWVLTSTIKKNKGILVDLFSKDGRLIDQFYLPLPQVESPHDLERLRMTLYKDVLFTVEKDEEDTPSIVKYQYQL